MRTNSPPRGAFFLPSESSDNPKQASAEGASFLIKFGFGLALSGLDIIIIQHF